MAGKMDRRHWTREFTLEFIEEYRKLPSLWRVKSKEYSDRSMKREAYKILVSKLKQVDRTATKFTAVKKIDSLRGNFRRELKKVKESKESGAAEVYKPSLWYFDNLQFLTNHEMTAEGLSNAEDTDRTGHVSETDVPEHSEKIRNHIRSRRRRPTNAFPTDSSSEVAETVEVETQPRSSSANESVARKRNNKCSACESVLPTENAKLLRQNHEDETDVAGRYIASKLRGLPTVVRCATEKLISDVIYEAQMGNINKFSRVSIYHVQPAAAQHHGTLPQNINTTRSPLRLPPEPETENMFYVVNTEETAE